jgi:hypothetical protein
MITEEKNTKVRAPAGCRAGGRHRPLKYPFNRFYAPFAVLALLAVALLALPAAAAAAAAAAAVEASAGAEPSSCQNVRLSDIGWTDVTAMTAARPSIPTCAPAMQRNVPTSAGCCAT